MNYRIGTGYDAHAFVIGRRLVLGGVEIPFQRGLAGHSDADALTHAIIDALLGAAGLKDIGTYFPGTDPKYEGIFSLSLLKQVANLVGDAGYRIGNIDATIIAQEPKMAPFIDEMGLSLSQALAINRGQISLKAKSNNGLGFAGQGEGLIVMATALLETKDTK